MTQGPVCSDPAICTRAPFFSTPLVDLPDGRPLGDAENADNSRVINGVKRAVANYIDSSQCVTVTLAPTPNPTNPPISNPTSAPVPRPTQEPTLFPTPHPTPAPTPQPTISCSSQEIRVTIDLNTDNWNHDSGFELLNTGSNQVELEKAVGDYPFPNILFVDQICLGAGTYTITFFDDWGDGICCNSGNGFFKVFIGDEDLPRFSSTNNDFQTESFTFDIVVVP
jgi:hypothetical protein